MATSNSMNNTKRPVMTRPVHRAVAEVPRRSIIASPILRHEPLRLGDARKDVADGCEPTTAAQDFSGFEPRSAAKHATSNWAKARARWLTVCFSSASISPNVCRAAARHEHRIVAEALVAARRPDRRAVDAADEGLGVAVRPGEAQCGDKPGASIRGVAHLAVHPRHRGGESPCRRRPSAPSARRARRPALRRRSRNRPPAPAGRSPALPPAP